jgi:lysophospholipase L1-like esterase
MKRSAVFRLMLTCFVLYAATQCLCSQGSSSFSGAAKKSMRILIIGDSNTEIGNITMPLKAMIDSTYGNYGTGYCTLNPNSMGRVPDSLTVSCDTNWLMFDMRNGWVPEPAPYFSPDGLSISSEKPGAAVTVRFDGTGIDLYYLQHQEGGRFTVSIDDRNKVTINTKVYPASTGKIKFRNLSSGRHTLTVKVNTGRVTLFGVDARRADVKDDTRFILHKWGNGWASTTEYTGIDRNVFTTGLKKLNPDKVVILLGTNDHGLDQRDALAVRDNLEEIITRIHEALPPSGVIVVSTFATSDSEAQGLLPEYVVSSFPDAARETQASYWDMYTWFGPYDPAKLEDGVHVNEEYGKKIAVELLNQLKN